MNKFRLKPTPIEASWEDGWPVNWEHLGTVFLNEIDSDEYEVKLPSFLLIDGVKYERRGNG